MFDNLPSNLDGNPSTHLKSAVQQYKRERFALCAHARYSTAESNPINACLFFFFALRLFLEKKEEVSVRDANNHLVKEGPEYIEEKTRSIHQMTRRKAALSSERHSTYLANQRHTACKREKEEYNIKKRKKKKIDRGIQLTNADGFYNMFSYIAYIAAATFLFR